MLVTNHVLAGAAIGRALRRPVPAFVVGVVSHFAMDAVPHYGTRSGTHAEFMRLAVRDGLTGLAALAVTAVGTSPEVRTAALAGALGAALPDLDKPWVEVFGTKPWPAVVNRFHDRIQKESAAYWPFEAAVAGAGVTALLVKRWRAQVGARPESGVSGRARRKRSHASSRAE
jgi:hypothetical protein